MKKLPIFSTGLILAFLVFSTTMAATCPDSSSNLYLNNLGDSNYVCLNSFNPGWGYPYPNCRIGTNLTCSKKSGGAYFDNVSYFLIYSASPSAVTLQTNPGQKLILTKNCNGGVMKQKTTLKYKFDGKSMNIISCQVD